MSVALIARKKMLYALQGYVPGEAFDARDEADASLLVTLGLASRAEMPQKAVPEPPSVPTEPEQVDEPTVEEPLTPEPEAVEPADEPRKRRTYRRRDLTAE